MIRLRPELPRPYERKARALIGLRELDAALNAVALGLEKEPGNGALQRLRGELKEEHGKELPVSSS